MSSSDPLGRCDKVSRLQVKYKHLAAQMSSVTSEWGIWCSLARERGDDTIILRFLHDSAKKDNKPLECQVAVVHKERETVTFDGDACNAKSFPLHAVLSCYREVCRRVAKRFDEDGVCFQAGFGAAANNGGDNLSRFLRGLVLSMKDYVEKRSIYARASVSERWSMVV